MDFSGASPYAALDVSRQQIRLLDIHPARRYRQVRASLRVVSLVEDSLEYEAVSYTWGPLNEGATVDLGDGHELAVTDNLANALRRFRRRFTTRTLWVDQLCINQFDIEERGLQVAMMSDIFRTARRVLVWLGDVEGSQRFALPMLWYWRTFSTVLMDAFRYHGFRSTIVVLRTLPRGHLQRLEAALSNNEGVYWHDRTWVIQEFAFAREVILCFGSTRYTQDFSSLNIWDYVAGLYMPHCKLFADRYNQLSRLRSNMLFKDHYGLINALEIANGSQACDTRDIVYSLYSFANTLERQLIQPNYGLSYTEVCAVTTRALIVTWGFTILCHKRTATSEDCFPSWAVDFRDFRARWPRYRSTFSTAFTRSDEAMAAAVLSPDSRQLEILAFDLDTIEATSISLSHQDRCQTLSHDSPEIATIAKDLTPSIRNQIQQYIRQSMATSTQSPSAISPDDAHFLEDVDRVLASYKSSKNIFKASTALEQTFELWNTTLGVPSIRSVGDSRVSVLSSYLRNCILCDDGCFSWITTQGFLGLGRIMAEPGDRLVLVPGEFDGMHLVEILQLRQKGDYWSFCGVAYVHGVSGGALHEAELKVGQPGPKTYVLC